MMWKSAIFGTGWAGERHYNAIKTHQNRIKLVALADSNQELIKSKAESWGVDLWTNDYHKLLTSTQLEAVIICLPHHLHAEAAISALEAGKHVLIEKPLANTLEEADAMIEAAHANQRILMVSENVRFDPRFLKAVDLINSNAIGEVFLFRIVREHHMHTYLDQRPWFLSDPGGGIMMSGGIHDFELVRMLASEIVSVYAVTAPKMHFKMMSDDTSLALAECQCGIRVMLQESFSTRTPNPGVHVMIYGRDGTLEIGQNDLRLYPRIEDGCPEKTEIISLQPVDTFAEVMAHFLDCLDGKMDKPITSAEEERKPLAAVLAAYQSIQTGLPVRLADMKD